MERVPVASSNIAAIGYDLDTQILEVEFTNGDVYQYMGVPSEIHEAFMASDSKGKFRHAYIRDYPYIKL